MRAASVRINDVSGVAGFVQPNDSVDVLVTRQLPNEANAQVTDVLLQNVRVIAIDQEAKNADGTPKVAKTATLEVDPLDAQKLALAQQIGDLSLVLRKPGEDNNPVVETVSMNDLRYNMYGGARYPAPAVVGSLGSSFASASDVNRAAQAARPRASNMRYASARKSRPVPADKAIEVYRGTKSDQVKVGGYGD
jgi:pilus assembly protein CpaB